jgi:hypothetical protein
VVTLFVEWQEATGGTWLQRYEVPGEDVDAAVDKALAELTTVDRMEAYRTIRRVTIGEQLRDVPVERVKVPLYARAATA